MNGTLLEAQARDEKASKVRKQGFVPGVIYNSNAGENRQVKFQVDKLEKYLKQHSGRKVQVNVDQDTEVGFIKELQRDPISGKILHLDIQVAGLNDTMKVKLPIFFEGRAKLDSRGLILDVYVSEVTVNGKEKDIPESLIVDVGDKNTGDVITASMLPVSSDLKLSGDPSEMIAIIINESQKAVPETETQESAAPEAE